MKLKFVHKDEVKKGGPGSGHHGHRGRPGKRGGSLPGSGSPGYTGELDISKHKEPITKALKNLGQELYSTPDEPFLFGPEDELFIRNTSAAYGMSSAKALGWGEDVDDPGDVAAFGDWDLTFEYDPRTKSASVVKVGGQTVIDSITLRQVNEYYNNPENRGKYVASYTPHSHALNVWKPYTGDFQDVPASIAEDYWEDQEKFMSEMGLGF